MAMALNYWQPRSDVEALFAVEQVLGLSEYQIFHCAYHTWYGTTPGRDHLDHLFGNYLRSGELPYFVRHHIRGLIERHPEYVADVRRRKRRERRLRLITLVSLIIAVAWALALT